MSYKYEVSVKGSWSGNGVRFATEKEADAAGEELLSRWWVPDSHRVVESEDPVKHRFNFEKGRAEEIPLVAADLLRVLQECGV